MDVLKAQFARIQQQLQQLSASQRMLAVSLVAVMVLTLLFWGRYAGTSDMEAVLDQPLNPDEIARITGQISNKGIEYKLVGDRIMVPADRKLAVLADLSYLQLVPRDTRSAYDEILKKVNPWSSAADNDATRNDAKAALLSQVIGKFPGVRSADVLIDPTNERRLGGGGRQPVAVAILTMDDPTRKKPDRGLVDGVAGTIMGAQSGLALNRITVVVNGIRYIASDRDSLGVNNGDEILTKQQESEQYFTQKISQQLNWFGAVVVAVTCDVNIKSERRSEELYDPKGAVQKESSTESEATEQSEPPPPAGEPGAFPNAAMSVPQQPSAGGGSSGSSKQRESTKFENRFSGSKSEQIIPAGKHKVLAATVRLPRSYFVSVYKMSNPTAQSEPDEIALKALVEAEIPKVRRDVKSCTAITSDEDIVVDTYPDGLPMLAAVGGGALVSGKSTNNFTAKLAEHYKEIGIGVLALISLFMVSSMVKKSTPVPVIAAESHEPAEPQVITASEDIAGEAVEGGSTLDGMELDDDAVKAQQMVEQVATMVKENPDAAANLVKRWLNRT